MEWVIKTNHLTKIYNQHEVLSDMNVQIPENTTYGIVGANGAGKSTFLRLIAGMIPATAGRITVLGEVLGKDPAQIRQRVHYVGTDSRMFPQFRVEEMLRYGRYLYERWDEIRCMRLVEALELPRKRRIRDLSTGMLMQLKLTMALSARPDLLLLDEPTNGLDPIIKRQFLQFIVQETSDSGMSVLLATHQLSDISDLADGVIIMHDGRTIASGSLEELSGRFKQIQVVWLEGNRVDIEEWPEVLEVEQRGNLDIAIVENMPHDFIGRLKSHGAQYVEAFDLDFAESFRYFMQKEGYTREGILLS